MQEAEKLGQGSVLCEILGSCASILTERTALNFLQLLSGTILTYHYAKALEGSKTRLPDTRKTIPGLRRAQNMPQWRGTNHRMGLYDAILIKENISHRFIEQRLQRHAF